MDLSEKTTDRIGWLLRFRFAKEHKKSFLRGAGVSAACREGQGFSYSTASYYSAREFKSDRLLFALTPEFTYRHTQLSEKWNPRRTIPRNW
jgi:hypothetical protein